MFLKTIMSIVVMMSFAFDFPKQVSVEVKSPRIDVENAKPFLFSILLRPVEGIHVNAEPQISIESETEGATLKVKEIHKSGDYLDSSKPIEIECKMTGMKPGREEIKFVLNYTYCSDTEGWCRMSRDTSSIELRVKK